MATRDIVQPANLPSPKGTTYARRRRPVASPKKNQRRIVRICARAAAPDADRRHLTSWSRRRQEGCPGRTSRHHFPRDNLAAGGLTLRGCLITWC